MSKNTPPASKAPANKPAVAATVAKAPAAKPAVKPATTKPVLAAKKPVINTTVKAAVSAAVKTTPVKVDTKKSVKPAKEKTPKLKMERDSFTMPKIEYAQFAVLKNRLEKLGQPAKKSELLRAGIMQLSAMTDAALKAAMSKVPAIKTGRPKKK